MKELIDQLPGKLASQPAAALFELISLLHTINHSLYIYLLSMQISTTLLIVSLAAKQREELLESPPTEENWNTGFTGENRRVLQTGESWQANALALPLCVSKMMVNCARRVAAVVGRQTTPAWTGATR